MPPPLRLSPEDDALIKKISSMVVRRKLAAPAIMLLEMGRPLNFVASQFLIFLRPFATLILNEAEYERFAMILEHREGVNVLVAAIQTEQENPVRTAGRPDSPEAG